MNHKPATMPPSLTLLLILTTTTITTVSTTTIGVTYIPSPTQPPPEQVATTLKSLKITAVRLPFPSPSLIQAFFYTNISLSLSIPNTLLPSLSSNRSSASHWLHTYVLPFYPRALITSISVGNNFLERNTSSSDILLGAIRNVHQSLMDLGIRKITVSTTFSFVDIMMTSFPPSSAEFEEPVNNMILKPLLQFLTETNSSLFINLFPYFVYKLRPEIPIGFALFQNGAYGYRDDVVTGVRYRNLFEMMVDAVIAALTISGHEDIRVVVMETGWPSGGGMVNEMEANVVYAKMYVNGLVSYVKSGRGTPLRKEGVAEVYVYEVFDTNTSFGSQVVGRVGTGQDWGFMHPNMSMKFKIDFSGGFSIVCGMLVKVVTGVMLLVIGMLVV